MSAGTARLWLLGLFIVHAAVHLGSFQAVYLDSDQLVIADQAAWMARGEFHEPFFFGQAYLLPFESYLAVPLIWLGVWPIAAVKAVTAASLYLPFAVSAWVLAKERPLAAWAVAALFVGLNPEYLLTAAMPRGFIAGTAIAWGCLWVLLRQRRLPVVATVGLAALVGFCTGSYVSIALMLPALAWLPGRPQWVQAGAGLLLGWLAFKALGMFYVLHPDHVVHPFPGLGFRIGYLVHHMGLPDIRNTVLQLGGLTAAACAVALWPGPGSWRREVVWPWLACLAGVGMAVLLMVGNNKIVEFNSMSPFFSVYRMMLPLPFLGLLLMTRRPAAPAPSLSRRWSVAILMGLVVVLTLQLRYLTLVAPLMVAQPSTVQPITFAWLRENCEEIGGWWQESREPYFLLEGRNDALAYGCHAQYGVPVLQTQHERRTWLKKRFAQGVPR